MLNPFFQQQYLDAVNGSFPEPVDPLLRPLNELETLRDHLLMKDAHKVSGMSKVENESTPLIITDFAQLTLNSNHNSNPIADPKKKTPAKAKLGKKKGTKKPAP